MVVATNVVVALKFETRAAMFGENKSGSRCGFVHAASWNSDSVRAEKRGASCWVSYAANETGENSSREDYGYHLWAANSAETASMGSDEGSSTEAVREEDRLTTSGGDESSCEIRGRLEGSNVGVARSGGCNGGGGRGGEKGMGAVRGSVVRVSCMRGRWRPEDGFEEGTIATELSGDPTFANSVARPGSSSAADGDTPGGGRRGCCREGSYRRWCCCAAWSAVERRTHASH
jgi:hypothetical protein